MALLVSSALLNQWHQPETDNGSECFIKYIRSKPVKRIESYRIKDGAPRRLLLPVSGGVSSLALLQILDRQIQRQFSERGRTAYELHILTVETPSRHLDKNATATLNALEHKYPSHTSSLIPLSEVFRLDSSIYEDFSQLSPQTGETLQASLDILLSCTRTASSQGDMLQVLLTRLIVAFAKLKACDAILWGHSNSRLAAKALSSVAKGRGAYVPFDIADGPSPWGIIFYYPLRDLFKSELVTYVNALPDDLSKLVIPDLPNTAVSKSLRTTSIDELLSDYIDTQGEKYPSIMANVVRTASKLQAPLSVPTQAASICYICAMPVGEQIVIHGIGESHICYSCQRLKLETRNQCDT